MAKYRCLVINNAGQRKNIVYEANDEFTLKAKLKNEKTILLNYELVKEKKVNTFFAVSSASFSEFDRDHKIKLWQSAVTKLNVF